MEVLVTQYKLFRIVCIYLEVELESVLISSILTIITNIILNKGVNNKITNSDADFTNSKKKEKL